MGMPVIPFHRYLKVVAVCDDSREKPARLMDTLKGEGFEVEVTGHYDRDVSLDADVGAYSVACDGELHEPARKFSRALSERDNSYDAGVVRLLSRRSDAFFGDRAVLAEAAMRSPDSDRLEVLPRLFTHETYALAMERGDEDFRLLVDSAISELSHSGEIANLYTAYVGEPSESALTLFQMNALPN